jgi:hypothetical protein
MNESTQAQLAAAVRELGGHKLTRGGHEYPVSALLWDMQKALRQFDPEAAPGLALDPHTRSLHDSARAFVAGADEFFRILSTTRALELRFECQELTAMLAAIRRGPALVDQLAGLLVR